MGRKRKRRTMRVKIQELHKFTIQILHRKSTKESTCGTLIEILDMMNDLFDIPHSEHGSEKPVQYSSNGYYAESLRDRKRACCKVLGLPEPK